MFPKIIIKDFDRRFLSSGRRTQSPKIMQYADYSIISSIPTC